MKKIILITAICAICTQANSQWNITGNAGTNATTNFIGTTDAKNLKIRTNNVVRMNITSSGKFAIGNFTPVFKLDVKGGSINTDSVYRIGGETVLSTKGSVNTFVGSNSGFSNTSGNANTAIGYQVLYYNTIGTSNTGNGYQALWYNTEGYDNTATGRAALYQNTLGISNTATGRSALFSNTEGSYNTANGYYALWANILGNSNTANGAFALYNNTGGYYNTANGVNALYNNTTASKNTAIGMGALLNQSFSNGGSYWESANTAVGYEALYVNQPTSTSNGVNNTAVGSLALRANTTGWDNTAMGVGALYNNNNGLENTATGRQALFYNTSGLGNTANGYKALRNNSTGNSNTALGYYADAASGALTNATAIGARAYVGLSNSLVLGSVNGINGAASNVNVGIGTYLPVYSLDVTGNTYVTGNFYNSALSVDNYGVYGACNNTPYYGYGVAGVGGYVGVYGRASIAGTGARYGVQGFGQGAAVNYGVYGYADGGTIGYAIYGSVSNTATNWAGYFSGSVNSTGAYVGSDRKLKNDIKPLSGALDILNQLKPSVYTFKTKEYKQMNLPEGLQYGLIADEVQKILPGAVKRAVQPAEYENHDEKNGKKLSEAVEYNALNYTTIIPILIGGMKERQKQIEKSEVRCQMLEEENEKLKNEIAEIKTALGLQTKSSVFRLPSSVFLEQNSPNPFNTQTEIKFRLPSTFSSAQLIITDANGKQVRTIELQSSAPVILNAGEHSAGAYTYSLIVDGVNVDTKQMILTK